MAPKSDKSATPSRSTSVPTGVPGASYADDAHTSVLEKPSPDWDQQRIKKEVRLLKSAVAAKAASEEDGHQRNARLDSLATLHGELDSRTSQLENKAEQLESGLAEQGTRHDARFTQQDRCLRAHAQQLDIHHVTMANQLSHKQLEKLATKEDIEQLLQSGKRARSATASPPAPSSDAEDEPAPKEPPSYEELQAELAAFKANQASTSKATSDKAKGRPFNKKAKHADNNKGGRAPEGSAEEARRQAEYHRRKAQEADALLAERKK